MTYQATVELTGTARSRNGSEGEEFYQDKHIVEAETIGAVFDALAEKAYDMYFQLSMWLLENRPENYSMESDYWYVNCSWPSADNPFEKENWKGGGSAVSNPGSFVLSVAHYRHMEVEGFFNRELKYISDGRYKKYVEGVKPMYDFFDSFRSDDVSKYLNFGYNGRQLDQVMTDMGEDLYNYLKDYSRYRNVLSRGKTVYPIILPERPSVTKSQKSSPKKPGLFKRLFGRR